MPRCLSCGRRVGGVHQPCGSAPAEPPREPVAAPSVPGHRTASVLGSGGFGAVLEAEREGDGRRVALKIARPGVPGAAAQLRREAEALRELAPPAVPALLGGGALADGTPWLSLQLVEAPSLARLLERRGGPLAREELHPACLAVADAVTALHAAGWAHGDLKPENVLVDLPAGRACLLDLGLAERLDGSCTPEPGRRAGTAEYMAPEQCEGRPADARSDVYALGVLLFEMATGRPPFFGPPGEVRHAHLTQRPPSPCSFALLPAALEAILGRCLAKSPADRYSSAGAVREALAVALDAGPPAGAPDAPLAFPPRSPGKGGPARAARRRVGVAFLEATADALALQRAAAGMGGIVAHAEQGRCALVFDPAPGENPVGVALRAARRARTRGLATRVRVDLVEVTVRARPGGAERYLSSAFGRSDAWPSAGDPDLVATGRAAEVLAGERLSRLPCRPDLFGCEGDGPDEPTSLPRGSPPLVGRDEVIADLLGEAERAWRGLCPTLASVTGEAGVGRTHLAAVLTEHLRRGVPAAEVVLLKARGGGAEDDGGVLRALLRALLSLPPGHVAPPADGGRALLTLALPDGAADELWAGAALALGWIAPGAPALRARAAAPGALTSLAVRAAAALLRGRAASRPLAVVLDDAHLADGAALDALELAALREGRAPLFVCALGLPSFAEVRPLFGERAGRACAVRLGPLPPPQAAELCRRLLSPAEDVPARAVEWLVERSQGVPLLLSELVRGLKRDGLVRPRAHGGSYYVATDELDRVPEMPVVEWLAGRELRGLPAGLAAHAQLVALLGDELEPEELSGLLAELDRAGHGDRFPLDAGAATRRLHALGILASRRGQRAAFRLPLVRDAFARSVPDALRQAIHEAAFRFYQRPGAAAEPVRLRRLAHHAAAAGHLAQAGAIDLQLAGELGARHAHVEAEARYSRALAHLPAGERLARLAATRGRGLTRSFVARYQDAVEDLVAARALARELGDRRGEVGCLLDEATALDWMNEYAPSQARAEEAARLAGGSMPELGARLEMARGRSLFRLARWDEAAAALRRSAAMAELRLEEDYPTRVVALLMLGSALPALGCAAEGEAALARAQELAEARGDLAHLAAVHVARRNLLVARDDLAGAVRAQEEAIRLGRELGLVCTEHMGEYNLAELHYQAADPAGAEPHLRRAREIEVRHPEAEPLPLSTLLWARLLLFTGELPGARRLYHQFIEGVRAAADRGVGLGPAEAVLADMVDLATRDGSDAEWDALVARSARSSIEQEPIEVLEMRGLAALRAGRLPQARAALRAALALAGRIPNLLAPRVERALAAAGG